MTIRESLTIKFQSPIQNMSFMSYLTYLNSAGKVTQRTLLDMLIVLCEQMEEREKQERNALENFRNIEDILSTLVGKSTPVSPVEDRTLSQQETQGEVPKKQELDNSSPAGAFPCDICGKTFKLKVALSGHKRSHK